MLTLIIMRVFLLLVLFGYFLFILCNSTTNYFRIKRCSVSWKKFFNALSYFFWNVTGIKGCNVLLHSSFGQETVKKIKKENTNVRSYFHMKIKNSTHTSFLKIAENISYCKLLSSGQIWNKILTSSCSPMMYQKSP